MRDPGSVNLPVEGGSCPRGRHISITKNCWNYIPPSSSLKLLELTCPSKWVLSICFAPAYHTVLENAFTLFSSRCHLPSWVSFTSASSPLQVKERAALCSTKAEQRAGRGGLRLRVSRDYGAGRTYRGPEMPSSSFPQNTCKKHF